MEYDEGKVDEMVLALLYLTMFDNKPGWRAWKSHDWDAMDRLHEKGYISDPKSKGQIGGDDRGRREAGARVIREAF
jgi:hypothetical protein